VYTTNVQSTFQEGEGLKLQYKEYKEMTIPITKFRFGCLCIVIIAVLGWITIFISSLPIEVRALGFVGALIGTILSIAFCSLEWDLNPIHKLGYCLRFKNENT